MCMDGYSRSTPSLLPLLCLILLLAPCRLTAMPVPATFCAVPAVPGTGVKPNLLLMLDNSASMYDPAYSDPAAYCVDDSFGLDAGNNAPDPYRSYPGYFNQDTVYLYDTANDWFVQTSTTLPAGCNAADTSYLCVDMAGVSPSSSRTVDRFIASGRFLNWLTMSKLDVEKRVLTGGKYSYFDPSTSQAGLMVPETRGCLGRRFVKITRDAPNVTFGVRGPIVTEDDYRNKANQAGQTRIEIYDRPYQKQACLDAINDWQQTGAQSKLLNDATQCLGGGAPLIETLDDGSTVVSRGKVNLDILYNCYLNPDNALGDDPELNVYTDCQMRIDAKYSSDPNSLPLNAGEDVCGMGLSHDLQIHDGVADTSGYIGGCYFSWYDAWDDTCAKWEAEDFCRQMKNRQLTDPTPTALTPGTMATLPGFIQDAGIYGAKEVSGTFRARLRLDAPPTGLLQEYVNYFNLGAMVFSDDGAGAECKHENTNLSEGGILPGEIACAKRCVNDPDGQMCHFDWDCATQCREITPTDGGRIIAAVGAPLGDHLSGLVAAIDGISATSWAPLAEAFYTAIGYFGNRTSTLPGSLWPQASGWGLPSSSFSCQRNNILLVTDGVSTADRHPDVGTLLTAFLGQLPSGMTTGVKPGDPVATPAFQGSYNLDDLAWLARNRALADFGPIRSTRDYLSTYVIYTGSPCGSYNVDGTCQTLDEGAPEKLMQLTAAKGGGVLVKARLAADLENAFQEMLMQIAAGSGSDPSLLATGNGNGAIFLQPQYYPAKSFDAGATSTHWIGEMLSLWYYIDPFLGGSNGVGSTVREDTDQDLTLNLSKDRVVKFQNGGATVYYDANGDGSSDDGTTQQISSDAVQALWRAGVSLWQKNPAERVIYTQSNGVLTNFTALGSDPQAVPLLQARDAAEAQRIVSYLTGVDGFYRRRMLTIPAGSVSGVSATASNVWKLGDVVSSTPKMQSSLALASYQLPAPSGYGDVSYSSFVGSNQYARRGTVYVGANDGMLHAFDLGRLSSGTSARTLATLAPKSELGETRADLGKEQWAFIPRNALPYLTYLKEHDYRHLFYVDGGVTLVDASIGDTATGGCTKANYWQCNKPDSVVTAGNDLDPAKNPWRTVLIGGMGLGGTTVASCLAGGLCSVIDPATGSTQVGLSSYFALDVTDPDHPSLLWEFSNRDLGFATTGPAIVRIGDGKLNGRWFAVFGSGPTGVVNTTPQSSSEHQMLWQSGQNLKFFVVDLRTGELAATLDSNVGNAFAGQMGGAAIDVDRWSGTGAGSYQDDALFVGYAQTSGSSSSAIGSNGGGVLRIFTRQDPDPTHWRVLRLTNELLGPVTGGIAKIQDRKNHNLWLYFGSGRYYFNQDDMGGNRALYGVKEPCYNHYDLLDGSCTATVSASNLIDQTSTQHVLDSFDPGWLIGLDSAGGTAGAERVITTPVATTGGQLLFSTYQPSADLCSAGSSYLWGVSYDSGGAAAPLQGTALVPLANGTLQETALAGAFTAKGGRRTGSGVTGKPAGMKIISNSGLKPLKKIIHIQER